MGYAMDGFTILDLALFAAGTFAAAFVTGLAGFAFGIVAAAVWLHFLAPAQAAALIVAFGLIVQGVSVWKLRRVIKWPRLMPFLVGGVIGVPIGAELLRWTAPGNLRIAVGAILVLFSRSEERRVGKECRSGWVRDDEKERMVCKERWVCDE